MSRNRKRIEPYLPRLYGYAFSLLRDAPAAADLLQDCALRAIAARDVPKDEAAYRAWLFRIMRNLFIDGLRRDQRAAFVFDADAADGESVEYWGGDERLIDQVTVRLAFQRLDARQREILGLVDIAGLSYREAAFVLDVPNGTVMSRISRARKKLLELIEDSNVRALPIRKGAAGDAEGDVTRPAETRPKRGRTDL
jgi:RNA polymerase sigma-70 factor (ECF subfamily)